MKTEPSAPIKVKLEKNESYVAPTLTSIKSETKVNLDIKPNVKIAQNVQEFGSTSVSRVTRTRKVRRKGGTRKATTKRKSTSTTYRKRKTKGGRRKRRSTTTTATKTRRKRTTKKLVTGKALTPRARICKKLGIERNLSLGIHSLPTIRKMTQENTINHKRAAAGIGVLSLFGSELNSHGSVPLRDENPDADTDLSGVDERSSVPEDHEDSYGPQLPPEDIPLEEDENINNPTNNHEVDNITTKAENNNDISTPATEATINYNIESTHNDNHEDQVVIDVKPTVQVHECLADQVIVTQNQEEAIQQPLTITEDKEAIDPEGESKSKLKRCKHGKIIHAKKHDSSKSKRSSSKDSKKDEPKSSLLRIIKKEPRDRDEERPNERDSRDNRGSRSSLPNRHEVDYQRRLTRSPPHDDERTSRHRENDRNRENREDRGHNEIKRKRLSASKERISPLPTLPVPSSTILPHLPPPPSQPTTKRSRSDVKSSKTRSSSSHKRDSSRNNRSPSRRESKRSSPHLDQPYESKTEETKKKFDVEEEDKSKGKKKKRKHKHKHSKYDDESDYTDSKSAKHDPIESSNGKRIPTNASGDKISTNNSRHHDHHHKKSKHRHHFREDRSTPPPPLPSSHKLSSSPSHREERDEKPRLSRSRSKRSRHSSPSDRDHVSSGKNRDDRRDVMHAKSGKTTVDASTDEVNTKEIKVKNEDRKDHVIASNTNNNVNNVNSKAPRSPSEIKSVLSKPGSPPKKDVRLVSKSRTEFDIFWDENSQNKKADHPDFDGTIDKPGLGKEETGLRFLPRTLLSDQPSPNVLLNLPPTVGPRTPPDDERAEKNLILSSPDQTMPTPTQDESLEADYSNGTPTKRQGSIKSLNSPSIDPDIYDPEAPLDSPEEDQLIKSEIARSQAKLNEMEKKLSPAEKPISAIEAVPRPETPEMPSSRSPHTNNIPTTANQHKFKSPIIPPLPLPSTTSSSRAPTLAESSLPPAPGSLLAQIQQTLNLQTKTHSSHSDSSKQLHQSHSSSTGLSSSSSSLQSSSFIHASGSSGNDQINKSLTPSTSTLPPNINSLSPSLKSLLENLIKAAEQQQSKTKLTKMATSSSSANNIFKKPAPVLDSKSRSSVSSSHLHHHSVKTKVIDKEATKKLPINQVPLPTGSGQPSGPGPGMKISDVTVLDDVPSSAVELQVKEKYLKKLNRQERVVEEVKMVLKPFYQRKEITKDEYKEIMRKAVPKICHSKSGEINPQKVRLLVEGYIQRYKHDRKKIKAAKGK